MQQHMAETAQSRVLDYDFPLMSTVLRAWLIGDTLDEVKDQSLCQVA